MTDKRNVGKPELNLDFRQARTVPVVTDKPRLNDQRKKNSRPRIVNKPTMGVRPSGGAQIAPKPPSDKLKGSYIEKRDVPVSHISETELAEWNPFASLYKSRQKFIPGDAIGYQITEKGIDLYYVRDGKVLQRVRKDSYETMTQKMDDLKQQFINLRQQRRSLSINPKKVAKNAAEQYAQQLHIQPNKIGELNRQVPIDMDPATPTTTSSPGMSNRANTLMNPSSSSSAAPGSPAGAIRTTASGLGGNTSPGNFSRGSPGTGNKDKWGRMRPVMNGTRTQTTNTPQNNKASVPPSSSPSTPTTSSGPMTNAEMHSFLKQINYPNVDRMTPYQMQQAMKNIKGGGMREGYPDTNYKNTGKPAHVSRIGNMKQTCNLENPKKPDLNREFAQFRDVDVHKISENSETEIDQMLLRTISRMGLDEDFKKLNTGKSKIHNPGSVAAVPKHNIQKLKAENSNSQMEHVLPRKRQQWINNR